MISFVLPCLNEEENINVTLMELERVLVDLKEDYEVIVVDNGSIDNSVSCLNKFNFINMITEEIKGYGSAIRKGIKEAKGDIICTFDLDGTYVLSSILEMENYIREYGLIVGVREYPGCNEFSIINKLGAKFLSLIGRQVSGSNIKDWHCGLRMFKREVGLKCTSQGMEFASEVILNNNTPSINIPVLMRDSPYKRNSKLRRVRDGVRHLRIILRGLYEK